MKVTSAEAAKILRKYNDDYASLCGMEEQSKSFVAAVGEDIETVRPQYDFLDTQKRKEELEAKIRRLKHEINTFNLATKVPGLDMTIDEVLVLIPQLSRKQSVLYNMKTVLPKTREEVRGVRSSIIDYRYANYDIAEAEKEYDRVSELLAKAQTALDTVNTTVPFEITE